MINQASATLVQLYQPTAAQPLVEVWVSLQWNTMQSTSGTDRHDSPQHSEKRLNKWYNSSGLCTACGDKDGTIALKTANWLFSNFQPCFMWWGTGNCTADRLLFHIKKKTSFSVCLASGRKIEQENCVLNSAPTFHTTCQPLLPNPHPWLTPLTPGDRWRLHPSIRDLNISFLFSPTASSLYSWADVFAPCAVSLLLFISLCFFLHSIFI